MPNSAPAPITTRMREAAELPGQPAADLLMEAAAALDAANRPTTRAMLVPLDGAMLANLLSLPEGCHIDRAWDDPEQPGRVMLRVVGAGPLGPVALDRLVRPLAPKRTDKKDLTRG